MIIDTNVPLFSIIVPVYNVKEYIEITIGSILEQTIRDFEILAIDDGSTDGSGDMLDIIALTDARVRVFHQPNSGVSAARNLGLDKARGKWIVFVDGDDALRLDALEILRDCISRNPNADLIGYCYSKTTNIIPNNLKKPNIEITYNELSDDCSTKASFGALNHQMVWTETFCREILGDLRFEPIKNGEDVLFCNGIGLKANKYIAIDAQLYFYLTRGNSAREQDLIWTQHRHYEHEIAYNGILQNLVKCKKDIDNKWLKRWVTQLLQYKPQVWKFNKTTQQKFLNNQRSLLRNVEHLLSLPIYLKIWIKIATAINSRFYYKITAMWPIKIYSKLKR